VAPSTLPSYDPRVIEQFADKLYRKASSFVAGSIVVGGALGALFGAVPLTSLGNSWPIPSAFGFATLLIGALCGAVVGYVIGDIRSFGYRLQAQAALCQLQIEQHRVRRGGRLGGEGDAHASASAAGGVAGDAAGVRSTSGLTRVFVSV
jgi:predicted lipid-binding transport protein (Tim44 family)